MIFHLLGLPNGKAGWELATNPFNTKILYMIRMLKDLGHEVIHYGVEGSQVEGAEHVDVVPLSLYNKVYKDRDNSKPDHLGEESGPTWSVYIKSTIRALDQRIKTTNKEFILNFLGYPLRDITDYFADRAIIVEPGIGHNGSYAPHRIFESHIWQANTYGKQNPPNQSYFPNLYDAVIPAYFDKKDYPYSAEKDDYFVFLGRVMWGKGISVAVELTRELGKKLIVIGGGNLDDPKLRLTGDLSHVEHVGALTTKQKVKYLSRARALIYFSLYIEPFGHAPIEAQLCGTPVIASNFGAFTETVLNGQTGYLAHTFGDLLYAGEHVKDIKPATCRKWAVDNFDLDRIKLMYDEYFKKLFGLYNGTDWYGDRPDNLDFMNRYYPNEK